MTDSLQGQKCAACGKDAKMQCPNCLKLKAKPTFFCSQECFVSSWGEHKRAHELAKAIANYRPPVFKYTGPIRPHFVSPMRSVPDHIGKPEYALSGTPLTEIKLRGQNKIHINSPEEIAGIREACRIGREILDIAGRMVRPGITTEEIDEVVHNETIKRNAYPSPLNYHFFPKSCCTSINEVICHGIPDARPLEDGDIVNLDISVYYKGFHGDLNETYCVGKVDDESKKLIKTTYDALMLGIEEVKPNGLVRDIGKVISKHVQKHGFSVVRSYCGHGIGALFHSAPNVPHYGNNKAIGVMKPGMVFTIEPMINAGGWQDKTWPDEWTSVTADGKRSAQFEHTLLVTESGVEVLTARSKNSPPLWWEEDKSKDSKASSDGKESKLVSASPESNNNPQSQDGQKKKKKKKKKKKVKQEGEKGDVPQDNSKDGEDGDDDDEGEEE